MVDEISKADLEFSRTMADNDDQVSEQVVASFNDRQEILARQSLDLLASFRRRATSREIEVVANALEHISDYPNAKMLYERAIKVARREGPAYLSLACERYGIFLFKSNQYDQGSRQLELAATVLDHTDGDRILRRKFAAIAMRAVHHIRYDYELDAAAELLATARRMVDEVRAEDFRNEMLTDLRDYESQLRGRRPGRSLAESGRRGLGASRSRPDRSEPTE